VQTGRALIAYIQTYPLMKQSLLILITLLFAGTVYAQIPASNTPRTQTLPPPLPSRQVSGIVKDSTDTTLPGAVVKLTSPHDTISTATNADGIFILKNVKSATFVLTVSSLGYRTQVKRLLNNDAIPRLTLDPIVLKSESQQLKEVVINGTPSITYKIDTIEYKASDYKVRPNATLDELLKKMEGFEIGSDGSVTHQGQAVTKIKLNGKDYGTGDIAQGIQNLPADIIEKAQVVDDYGDQAAHTGIKSGDPQKVLNVTTRADKSVGTTGRLTAQAGDHDRYNAQLFVQRINANQQIGLIGGIQNLVTGIASTGTQGGNGGSGGSPGTALVANPTLNYRDQFGPKVQINSSVGYNLNNRNSTSQSYGNSSTSKSFGSFSDIGNNRTNTNGRQFKFELDYQIDSLNYLQIQPNYSYSTTETSNNSTQDNVTNTYVLDAQGNRIMSNGVPVTTFEHRVTSGVQSTKTPNTTAGALALYVHRFRTPNRALSVQASYNWSNSQSNTDFNNDIRNYGDTTRNILVKDSLAHTLKYSTNVTNATRLSTTYSEPFGKYGRLVFNGQSMHNDHDVNSYTDLIDANGIAHQVDTLAQRYNYATTDTRLTFNYQYQGTKVNLAVGVLLEPYSLSGSKLNAAVGQNVTITQNVFQVLPVFRFSYAWSRTERIALNYTSNIDEPSFSQLEPYTDRSNANNIVVGNPNLKPSLTNGLNLQYNNYFPNSRFNVSVNGNGTYKTNEVTSNVVQVTQILTPAVGTPGTPGYKPAVGKTYNVTNFVNLTGDENIFGNYNISKQLADRRYNLALNGTVNYRYNTFETNNQLAHTTGWSFTERFGPRINPTDNIEINPYVSTSLGRTFNTTIGNPSSTQVTNTLAIDGRFYFFKTYNVHYDARKQFINLTQQNGTGVAIPSITASPLVIDAGFQKEIGQKRQFTITFDVFDILHQNNFIQQTAQNGGVTNTISSSLSRYFLVGFRLNLQKWSGRPTRNGKNMQRRGDGSFIYN
jgi:hypothetical protein